MGVEISVLAQLCDIYVQGVTRPILNNFKIHLGMQEATPLTIRTESNCVEALAIFGAVIVHLLKIRIFCTKSSTFFFSESS